MTAINHALTGASIGLLIGEPLVALPLALLSHYICDIIPHFGSKQPVELLVRSRLFQNYLIFEALLCFILVALLMFVGPANWSLAIGCAFLAAAPDLLSAKGYLKLRRRHSWRPGRYANWAHHIQWFERPIGASVEVAWFIAGVAILIPFMQR